MKRVAALLLVALIAFIGVVSHAMIASGYVDAELARMGEKVGIEPEKLPERETPITIPGNFFYQVAGNGVYNFHTKILDAESGEWREVGPLYRALLVPVSADETTWGVGVPYPFLIPFVVHLCFVWFIPVLVGLARRRSGIYFESREYAIRVLISAVYAYFIVMFFQSTRMIWGSQMWEPDSYLNSYRYGWVSLYLLLGLSIAIYLYCVLATAGLQVRRKPTAKKQTCIRCGYRTEGLERCPECDLEVGAFIDSKWRINHWYLAAMFVVTFFSPVMVESVYSVFG